MMLWSSKLAKPGVFCHGFNYGGHSGSCAKAFEAPRTDEETNNISHARQISPAVQNRLWALETHNLVDEMRGERLIGAIGFITDKPPRELLDAQQGGGAYLAGRVLKIA